MTCSKRNWKMCNANIYFLYPVFSILSTNYVSKSFKLCRVIPGSILSRVWNPYSLLHILIYGVLMIFLVLSFGLNPNTPKIANPLSSFLFLPGCIAPVVGVLDELNQIFIPGRDASVTDVMLDIIGITLTAIFVHFHQPRRKK